MNKCAQKSTLNVSVIDSIFIVCVPYAYVIFSLIPEGNVGSHLDRNTALALRISHGENII